MLNIAELPKYESYRDSGVEWLGKLPEGWSQSRLKLLVSIKTGEKDTAHRVDDGDYPFFIRSPNVQRIDTYSFDGEAILTAGDGDIGKIFHYINGKFDYHQRVYKFSDFKKVQGKYLYYFLQYNLAEEVVKLSAKTTVDSLRLPYLQNFVVAIPTQQEQLWIVKFLDKKSTQIDEAIAIKEQQIALLKERKQIIIQRAVIRGLDPDVPMKDSGVDWIGEIPAHWTAESNRSLFSERVEPGKDGLPLLSVSIHSGVSTEEVSEDENIRGRVKIQDKTKYMLVKAGDIAFNMMRAWQGGIGAVTTDGMVSPAYIVAKPKGGILAEYFEYQYRCPEFIQQMDRYSKGITDFRKRLYWDSFKQLKTVVPPKSEQIDILKNIEGAVEAADSGIGLLVSQIEKLKEYKTTLINSAVTGKIKITPDMLEA